MTKAKCRIAVVAPANRLTPETAEKVGALARETYGAKVSIFFHPQCFLTSGHFAGTDAERSGAFLEVANDPGFDAVWFGRGGYGSCRLDGALFSNLNRAAHLKDYLGYSDMGFLLGRLAKEGVGRPAHGPMPSDINREGGNEAVVRALAWLIDKDGSSLEPTLQNHARRAFAFNLTVLAAMLGTPAEANFSGAELMIEDVDEQHYRIDRAMYHVTSSENVRNCAGIRLGRVSRIPLNDPPFEKTEAEIVAYWCDRTGIPFLGVADIGHDERNKIVPFPQSRSRL